MSLRLFYLIKGSFTYLLVFVQMPGVKRTYSMMRPARSGFRRVGPYKTYRRTVAGFLGQKKARRARLRSRNIRTAGYLGIENKFYDTRYGETAVSTTTAGSEADPGAGISCLNAVTQGDGESQRDGKKIMMRSIELRGRVGALNLADDADPPASYTVRVLLVLDTQTNGAQLNSEDVLLDQGGTKYLDNRNLQYSSRFRILWDKYFTIEPFHAMADGANTGAFSMKDQIFRVYRKLNIPVNYTGTTEAIANITDNSLHVIALGNNANAFVEWVSRLRFVG